MGRVLGAFFVIKRQCNGIFRRHKVPQMCSECSVFTQSFRFLFALPLMPLRLFFFFIFIVVVDVLLCFVGRCDWANSFDCRWSSSHDHAYTFGVIECCNSKVLIERHICVSKDFAINLCWSCDSVHTVPHFGCFAMNYCKHIIKFSVSHTYTHISHRINVDLHKMYSFENCNKFQNNFNHDYGTTTERNEKKNQTPKSIE